MIPTDTLYGLVGSALSPAAVERIYRLKGRDESKPFIILIGKTDDLKLFGIRVSVQEEKFLSRAWPGKVSVILPCRDENFSYLHRGWNTLAFRLPNDPQLNAFLLKTGPLVAPSVNPQGKSPAKTPEEAQAYFGNRVDFYLDGGERESPPSTIVAFEENALVVKREGAVDISLLTRSTHSINPSIPMVSGPRGSGSS